MGSDTLLQVQVGSTVRIVGFEGGKTLAVKLRQYGLFVGDQARIIRQALDGPILLDMIEGRLHLGTALHRR